jgi:hypothetical protein
MGITARPGRKSADEFIQGAPDGGGSVAPVPGGARQEMDRDPRGGGRKKAISLTIDPAILAELDRKAGKLGLSRAAAFALAVSRFIANEDREANR